MKTVARTAMDAAYRRYRALVHLLPEADRLVTIRVAVTMLDLLSRQLIVHGRIKNLPPMRQIRGRRRP